MVFYVSKMSSSKSNFSIVKIFIYPFKGLFYVLYLFIDSIYQLAKYFFLGLEYLLTINFVILKKVLYGILFICISIYHIFKYSGKGVLTITYPVTNVIKHSKKDKINEEIPQQSKVIENPIEEEPVIEEQPVEEVPVVEEEPQTTNEDELLNLVSEFITVKEQEYQELQDKKALREEKLRKKKNDQEAYINTNVKLEKVTFGQKLKQFGASIALFFGGIGKKFTNNSFSKNRRNKKDMERQALLIDFEGEDAKKSDKKVLYEYVAKDKNGKIIKDYFNAYSKVEVHSYLLSEGYEVYSIRTNKLIQLLHSNSNTNKTKFKNKDLIFFLTQLSTYIKAGIPLVEALRIISRQYKKKAYQKIFRSVIYELTIGESFSAAMEKQNVAFPKLLINMVKTAEMTGSLPEVLDDMANYYSEAEATRKQMISAMTYPMIVFVFAIGVMIFVMVYVVPKFVEIYETMEATLPLITIVVLKISDILQHFWWLIIIIVVAIIAGLIALYKKVTGFRASVQWLLMHTPVFNNVIIYNEVTMFTKTFSSLLAHNVPITDCMEILNKITNNEIYKMLILDTITNLAKGGKISDAFKDHWAFPIPAYEMIVTGEMTGELSEMMNKVSLYYQDLHKNAVTRIKAFVEPALTIFLTFGVGIILLSIIIPMFNMYSAVQSME